MLRRSVASRAVLRQRMANVEGNEVNGLQNVTQNGLGLIRQLAGVRGE